MKTASPKISDPQFVLWGALSVVSLFLLYWQIRSGDVRLISLPLFLLSLGMLCFSSREFFPAKGWLRRLLVALALVLWALDVTALVRLFLRR